MSFLPSRSNEWQAINRIEEIKAILAELRRLIADIEAHTLNYNPLNPDESLDAIYQLAKRGQRELEKPYEALLDEWEEAVRATRGGELSNEEAADLESHNNLSKTRQMGKTRKWPDGRGIWRRNR